MDGAERWGLDAMWLGELHFDPARSVLSAPLCIASAIAARTQRMKIGLAVQVLPLCHPLRLAEEAATVDQISHGRLIFGVGRSGVARTYEAYGVPYAESRERFAEVLDIVRKAWTQETVSYQGKYHHFEDVAVVPQPYQQPTPPIRVAATSADTFVSIGAAGPADLRGGPLRDGRRDRATDRGLPRGRRRGPDHAVGRGVPARARLYRADRRAGAGGSRAEPDPLLPRSRRHCWRIRRSVPASMAPIGAPRRRSGWRAMTYEEALRGTVLIGSPGSVAERLRGTAAGTGAGRRADGAELRRQDPACTSDDGAAAAVPGGDAAVSLISPGNVGACPGTDSLRQGAGKPAATTA